MTKRWAVMHKCVKICAVMMIVTLCFLQIGCGGNMGNNLYETEANTEQEYTKEQSTIIETSVVEQENATDLVICDDYLREIPELGYHTPSKFWDSSYASSGYLYYKDILIVDGTIYMKKAGEYQKDQTVSELIGRKVITKTEYLQYKNLLICATDTTNNYGFLFYDLDTWECIHTEPVLSYIWSVFQGQLIYLDADDGNIYGIELTGTEVGQPRILYAGAGESPVTVFRIRDDGSILIGKREQNTHNTMEYWMAKLEEDGIREETKIWETPEWERQVWLDFNQYGLIIEGDAGFYTESPFGGEGETRYDTVALKEDGKVLRLGLDRMASAKAEYILLDNGCLMTDGETRQKAASVSFYGYDGIKLDTVQLVDEALIGQGYQLIQLIYDYKEGVISSFYQNGAGDLYISQVLWSPE